jgi:ribosomal protein S18 acetylase RimI-like enzyme
MDGGRLYVDRRKDEIYLLDIALLPEFQKQGIGTQLMYELLRQGRAAHLPIRLHVRKNNAIAIRFYQHLGSQKRTDTGVHFLMEWQPVYNS